jgi:hypothetical protein
MPRMILSLAPASALLSGSVGWRGRDSSSVAATQLPRTRRPADRRAVRPASCQATGVGVGIERLGREYRTACLRTGDQRRYGHGGEQRPSGHMPAVVGRQRASPHRSLGCRPAAASAQRSRRRWHPRPSRRGRARVVPSSGAEYALGLVPHREANRQGRLVRAEHRTARILRRRPIRSAGITAPADAS